MRSLPIYKCYVFGYPEKSGLCNVIIVRAHPGRTYSLGVFLVDTFCCGVKYTFYQFSLTEDKLQESLEKLSKDYEQFEVDYVHAHNIVYGAMEYALNLGIDPHKDFDLTKYFLEEDDDNVPLEDYEFGRNGMPTLICDNPVELDKYRKILLKSLREDEFKVIYFCSADQYEDEDNFPLTYNFKEEYRDILSPIFDISIDLTDLTDMQLLYFQLIFPLLLKKNNKDEYPIIEQIFEDWEEKSPDDDPIKLDEEFYEEIKKFNEYLQSNNHTYNSDVTDADSDQSIFSLIYFNLLYDFTYKEIKSMSDDAVQALYSDDDALNTFLRNVLPPFIERYCSILDDLYDAAENKRKSEDESSKDS